MLWIGYTMLEVSQIIVLHTSMTIEYNNSIWKWLRLFARGLLGSQNMQANAVAGVDASNADFWSYGWHLGVYLIIILHTNVNWIELQVMDMAIGSVRSVRNNAYLMLQPVWMLQRLACWKLSEKDNIRKFRQVENNTGSNHQILTIIFPLFLFFE